jgi:3-oxoacyl-[acyl-carrier protein] reductase
MNLELLDKNVLVTAASKGIGYAIAKQFAFEGAKIVICSANEENIKTAVEKIKSISGNTNVWGTVCNLNNNDELLKLIDFTKEKFGKIDILVNNCGGPTPGFFENLNESDWDYSYNQVLKSAMKLIKFVLPDMKENKFGRIINITSISVKQPVDNLLLSNTFRSGLTAFAKTISNELAPHNITVNNIAPGYTLTDRFKQLITFRANTAGVSYDDMVVKMSSDIPMKRFANPDEIGNLAVFLASPVAGYITGTTINADGGYTKSTY